MFLRIIYDAKIGKDRQVRETYTNAEHNGDMRLLFDHDLDWSQPVFMILTQEDPSGVVYKDGIKKTELWADPVEFGEVPLDQREISKEDSDAAGFYTALDGLLRKYGKDPRKWDLVKVK